MLNKLLKENINCRSVSNFLDHIRQGVPSAVFGVNEPFKNYLISRIDNPVLYVVKDNLEAQNAKALIENFSNKKVFILPAKDELLIRRVAFSKDTQFSRITTIANIENADVIIVPAEALIQLIPKNIRKLIIEKDKDYNEEKIISKLTFMGYERCEKVEGKGTFSVRGDIIDIFNVGSEKPVRIEFFGDTVENIKCFDLDTGRSTCFLEKAEILQATETIFSLEELNKIKEIIRIELSKKKGDSKIRLSNLIDDILLSIENNDFDSLSVFAPLSCSMGDITQILPCETVVIFSEVKRVNDTILALTKEFSERYSSLCSLGEAFSVSASQIVPIVELIDKLKKFTLSALQNMATEIAFFSPLKTESVSVSAIPNYRFSFKEVFGDIKNWLSSSYKIIATTGSNERLEKFSYELSINKILSIKDKQSSSAVTLLNSELNSGFISHEDKVVVIGSGNLFALKKEKKTYKSKRSVFFDAPDVGDYCVHAVHGIGRALGSKKITTIDGTKDYIAVEYFGKDVLYVPVEQIDVLTRYLGGEKNPKLSKIGGKDFERIKERVRQSIKKMSFDLKKLYEERNAEKGFKFTDDDFQELFEGSFKYEDTPDQITATEDIKKDMLSGKVMDRLICGDVGFGKTEVAFRAVFRAIENGKQVAMLAPTTILTEQHFSSAIDRFSRFGIRIECLNRFRTKKQQENIIERLKSGNIDLVIGTHRLLGADVKFKDLGLLVLDEEQRFGVEHKEKIKLLKKNVDTLTLTATPIPRTLHMSLSGIRSISTINTPPKTRLPVQTYVTEETDGLLTDAITKELNRGGQVFLLYNRVETIFSFAERIKKLLPQAKITVCHGQMEERRLEKSIMEFYKGESNVLISTTIIENGIDLPNANTIIIIDADKLGLSTLYQLKGRVGRGDRLAYAYFTFKRDKVLTDTAYHRLNAITEFTEMGSGIKIAMRDLEIRGAGNVLGAEQHGHMDKIGYELYSKLLKEELTGEEEIVPELDIRLTAYIPENYIENRSARMDIYKEIAELTSKKEEDELKAKLIDVYGEMPLEMNNLFSISAVKRLASRLKAKAVNITKDKLNIELSSISAFSNSKLTEAIDNSSGEVVISVSKTPSLEFTRFNRSNSEMLLFMKEFLTIAVTNN